MRNVRFSKIFAFGIAVVGYIIIVQHFGWMLALGLAFLLWAHNIEKHLKL